MSSTPTRDALDRLVPGGLTPWLDRQRQAGVPYRAMASLLAIETGVRVSRDTVRRWCLSDASETQHEQEVA